jgi:hypothetical protein
LRKRSAASLAAETAYLQGGSCDLGLIVIRQLPWEDGHENKFTTRYPPPNSLIAATTASGASRGRKWPATGIIEAVVPLARVFSRKVTVEPVQWFSSRAQDRAARESNDAHGHWRNQTGGQGVSTIRSTRFFPVRRFASSVQEAATMARQQTPAQRETVERVMHEFKHGELKSAGGAKKVNNPKQAIAIALHEAGASKFESPQENTRNLRRTKEKERRGETYRDEAEGRSGRTAKSAKSQSSRGTSGNGQTRAELYGEAKRRNIPGRSKMNKQQLAQALHK